MTFEHGRIYAHTYGNEVIKQWVVWSEYTEQMYRLDNASVSFTPKSEGNYYPTIKVVGFAISERASESDWVHAYEHVRSYHINTLSQLLVSRLLSSVGTARVRQFLQDKPSGSDADTLDGYTREYIQRANENARKACSSKQHSCDVDISFLEEAYNG